MAKAKTTKNKTAAVKKAARRRTRSAARVAAPPKRAPGPGEVEIALLDDDRNEFDTAIISQGDEQHRVNLCTRDGRRQVTGPKDAGGEWWERVDVAAGRSSYVRAR